MMRVCHAIQATLNAWRPKLSQHGSPRWIQRVFTILSQPLSPLFRKITDLCLKMFLWVYCIYSLLLHWSTFHVQVRHKWATHGSELLRNKVQGYWTVPSRTLFRSTLFAFWRSVCRAIIKSDLKQILTGGYFCLSLVLILILSLPVVYGHAKSLLRCESHWSFAFYLWKPYIQ